MPLNTFPNTTARWASGMVEREHGCGMGFPINQIVISQERALKCSGAEHWMPRALSNAAELSIGYHDLST
jgi:hypothetical protein